MTGPNLAEAVDAGGPLPLDRAVDLARDLLRALTVAHTLGVPHGRIRPGVVRLPDGRGTQLAGFTERLKSPLWPADQAAYGCPEHARGELSDLPGDLFSLASTLYFAVAGRAPFRGDSPLATAIAVIRSAPPSWPVTPLAGLLGQVWSAAPGDRPTAAEALAMLPKPA